eukprot:GHVR01015076.1.p1 GENE.GHVR01015076.1~~GHVR01015076.1.p1  ORF type:complete len:437 (+),score=138.72 GHVR01015076.1:440-1750(+)
MCLRELTNSLWSLWGSLIIGQSILIVASNPSKCANTVLSLLSLISPLEFNGDYRPYFNTFDPDFKVYQQSNAPQSGAPTSVVIGASNPLFVDALKHFNTVVGVSLPRETFTSTRFKPSHSLIGSSTINYLHTDGVTSSCVVCESPPPHPPRDIQLLKLLRHQDEDFDRGVEGTCGGVCDGVCVCSSTHTHTRNIICDHALKQHFHTCTEDFLYAFTPYFTHSHTQTHTHPHTHTHTNTHFHPLLQIPELLLFSPGLFLSKYLHPKGVFTTLPRKKCIELYKRFIDTPTFRVWFRKARSLASIDLRCRHLASCLRADPHVLAASARLSELAECCASIRCHQAFSGSADILLNGDMSSTHTNTTHTHTHTHTHINLNPANEYFNEYFSEYLSVSESKCLSRLVLTPKQTACLNNLHSTLVRAVYNRATTSTHTHTHTH